MRKRITPFTIVHIVNTLVIVAALALPSWFPMSWAHVRVCLIVVILWEAAILLFYIGCISYCHTNAAESDRPQCLNRCGFIYAIWAGMGSFLLALCLLLNYLYP